MAARDYDEDPEHLALACMGILRYAEAKAVYDTGEKVAIQRYQGSMMDRVEEIAFELAQTELDARSGMGEP